MKNQAFFSSEDKSEKNNIRLLHFFYALRVKMSANNFRKSPLATNKTHASLPFGRVGRKTLRN